MAGQLKEVRNRIKSVQSTQQITKAMKMVSAAKLRRAQDAIIQMRPYAQKLQEMLSNIVSNSEGGGASMPLAIGRWPSAVGSRLSALGWRGWLLAIGHGRCRRACDATVTAY